MTDLIITDENFNQYFRDITKHARQDGDILVSYRSLMELPDCQLKRDVIRFLTEVDHGANLAVEALMRYAAASKHAAIALCARMTVDLAKEKKPGHVAGKTYQYESVLFFYINKDHFPKSWLEEKNSSWAIVPDEIAGKPDI